MEYVVNLMRHDIDPTEWARRQEGAGWHQIAVADHLIVNRPFPHVWVTAAALATATTHVRITTAFVNNLFRHPVEVAHAALGMQRLSGGRFSLGLGAGWAAGEMEATGREYPGPRDRAGAFVEAAQITKALLRTGSCVFSGEYYQVDIDLGGPDLLEPTPLVCSVGGPRTIREVTPHADVVELKAASPATRGGVLDVRALGAIPDQHLFDLIGRVRAIDPNIPIGIFVFCAIGDDAATKEMKAALGDGLYSRFTGEPNEVSEGMHWLAEQGITRVQLSPIGDAGLDLLARVVL